MAFKNFSKLTPRNQSTLISQLHKLINYYSSIFSTRERVYLKKISKIDGTIYWLEDDTKKLVASAILDPNYVFVVDEVEIVSLGHTISKRPGQMERLLDHVFTDFEEKTIAFLCKPFVAESLQSHDFGLKELSPIDLQEKWPSLANLKTDYFNVAGELFVNGLSRKGHHVYLRVSPSDEGKLKEKVPKIFG